MQREARLPWLGRAETNNYSDGVIFIIKTYYLSPPIYVFGGIEHKGQMYAWLELMKSLQIYFLFDQTVCSQLNWGAASIDQHMIGVVTLRPLCLRDCAQVHVDAVNVVTYLPFAWRCEDGLVSGSCSWIRTPREPSSQTQWAAAVLL